MKYTGQLVTGDFEENTMTFEIEGEMILQAGKYTIARIENESELENLCIADVVWQSEQLRSSCDWCNDNNLPIDGGTSYNDLG